MITVLLDKNKHDRKSFDYGNQALNNYLQLMANQQSKRNNTRTYVLENKQNPQKIIGFYTLTMIQIDLTSLPKKLQKKHQNSSSAGLIARLAVDKRFTKNGYGEWLLVDALLKLLNASEIVGFPMIVVDSKDGSIEFYKKFGFTPFHSEKNKLFITVETVKKSFKSI